MPTYIKRFTRRLCHVRVHRTVTSSSSAATDDDVGGSVTHVRTYQVYRGMSPEAVNRLEVGRQLQHLQVPAWDGSDRL